MNDEQRDHAASDESMKGRTGEAIDPVCGMTVTIKPDSRKVDHGGQAYYFCSAKCCEKFIADPDLYLKPGQASETAVG